MMMFDTVDYGEWGVVVKAEGNEVMVHL